MNTEKYTIGRVMERASKYGNDALSDREMLSLFIGDAAASDLLYAAGSLANLSRWGIDELQNIRGIGKRGASAIVAAFGLSSRALSESHQSDIFNNSSRVYRYMLPETSLLDVEKFWVLCLDRKNRLIKRVEVTKGTATSCLAHPREVFRSAIQISATAIIAVHNHPSGDPAPSRADIQVTRQLRESAKVIGIDLHDHIIIGHKAHDPQGLGYYSFNEAGLI